MLTVQELKVPVPEVWSTLTVIEVFEVRAVIVPSTQLVAVLITLTRSPRTNAPVLDTAKVLEPVPIATEEVEVTPVNPAPVAPVEPVAPVGPVVFWKAREFQAVVPSPILK